MSFEDAFWMLLVKNDIPRKSVILIPNYYCMDVVENIRNHGYEPILYKLNEQLQATKNELNTIIAKHKPRVLILFHACGITNTMTQDNTYMKRLCRNMVVIEDHVHRLINPDTLRFASVKHFHMDSLRKVTPLSGSNIYAKKDAQIPTADTKPEELRYVFVSFFLFVAFRIVFIVGVIMHSGAIIRFAHKKILRAHDDIIGDSVYGYPGKPWDLFLYTFIDFARMERRKTSQVRQYERLLTKLPTGWRKLSIPKDDYGRLHVYPLVLTPVSPRRQKRIEAFLEKHGVPVWFKFPDSPWAKNRGVLFLPLGYHVSYNDLQKMCHLIRKISHE